MKRQATSYKVQAASLTSLLSFKLDK